MLRSIPCVFLLLPVIGSMVLGDDVVSPPVSRPLTNNHIELLSGELFPDDAPTFELVDPQPVPSAEITFDEVFIDEPTLPDVDVTLDVGPAHWANELIDVHALIYRETKSGVQVIGAGGGLGMTSLGFSGDVSGDDGGPFWINTKFGWHFLDGPGTPDVRPQLYDLAVEINYAQQLGDAWSLHLQASPTWASDFDNKDSEAFRLIGGGLLAVRLSPLWTLVGGATFLDREDLPVLPIAGLKLATDDVELDLLIPRPRFAIRTAIAEDFGEDWLYVSGEVGGGSWAFEREDTGLHDVLGYRDLRLLVGWETREIDGTRQIFEAGYLFDRHIEFKDGPGNLTPSNTWVIRWGTTY